MKLFNSYIEPSRYSELIITSVPMDIFHICKSFKFEKNLKFRETTVYIFLVSNSN